MKLSSSYTKRRTRIEIIPLIDIVFFLLATFVMVSLSMVKNEGMPVNLPSASTAAPQEHKVFTTISITRDGTIYLDKTMVTPEVMGTRLQSLKTTSPDLQVFIHGDEQADFGTAMKVLDTVRGLGIHKVAVQTRPEQNAGVPA